MFKCDMNGCDAGAVYRWSVITVAGEVRATENRCLAHVIEPIQACVVDISAGDIIQLGVPH